MFCLPPTLLGMRGLGALVLPVSCLVNEHAYLIGTHLSSVLTHVVECFLNGSGFSVGLALHVLFPVWGALAFPLVPACALASALIALILGTLRRFASSGCSVVVLAVQLLGMFSSCIGFRVTGTRLVASSLSLLPPARDLPPARPPASRTHCTHGMCRKGGLVPSDSSSM